MPITQLATISNLRLRVPSLSRSNISQNISAMISEWSLGNTVLTNCQAGCANVRRALRNKVGPSTSDALLGQLLRIVGTVRLRIMPGCPMPEPCDSICARSFPFSPLLGVVGWDDNGPALCFARSPGRRWCRSMMPQLSGPSSSLTLAPALCLRGFESPLC